MKARISGLSPGHLDNGVHWNAGFLGNGRPLLFAVGQKALNNEVQVIHTARINHMRFESQPQLVYGLCPNPFMDRGDRPLGGSPKRILAKTVARLKQDFPEIYESQAKLGKSAGCSQSTIDRLEEGETDTRISTVAGVAGAFGFALWQILVPDFNPKHPPRLDDLTADERAAIDLLRRSKK